ncbi:uncharacterized protein NECHADRAFT_88957 [Fusarium vanettenii 77-13-4]|uniref:Altered inheritance of mitochondria protein 6 n=1 Tax=Fusarium vanettenii (strain ATCC MYA-4622 / CBS 123669 / FGSC 9596 / NRRL 45880 / 77-13-4) TaxID=660122 RepID=C7ZJK1_FUSV7|nr:uncharacterized protein NECHADRAFT_88957 [Fusarium vanettenii 77-13-4]EEU35803.1 hypothetical protein NECHADRAFT_88957 [Fusarium vanettenii 77-13-4]
MRARHESNRGERKSHVFSLPSMPLLTDCSHVLLHLHRYPPVVDIQANMGIQAYFRGGNLADAIEYQLLTPQRGGDSWQGEHHQPQLELRVPGAHKGLVYFWFTAVCGTTLIVAPFFLLASVILPKTLDAYETSRFAFADRFEQNGNSTSNVAVWLAELSPLVFPVMCHSHNDYWRLHPLFSALAVGCASTEADVWLSPDGKDLLVGHDRQSLSSSRTLRSLYLDPLLQILNSMNPLVLQEGLNSTAQARGVFAIQPNTTLILFVDVKDDPVSTWPLVLEQLGPLRDRKYLARHEKMHTMTTNQSFWPGPVTIVGTGNILKRRDINMGADPEKWQQYHDVFLDAPLDLLTETGFSPSSDFSCHDESENEFYTASASFKKTIRGVRAGFNKHQLITLRDQIQIARQRNLKSRYWGLPCWPISYRDYVWRILTREGIDLLNADNVVSAAMKHWDSDYTREAVWICITTSYLFVCSIGLIWYTRRFTDQQVSIR